MGFLRDLFSITGPGKMQAAENALIAKYMYLQLTDEQKNNVVRKIKELLVSSDYPAQHVDELINKLTEDRFFSLAALAFHYLGVAPALKGLTYKDGWNRIDRPLIALNGAKRVIEYVELTIKHKHGIQITLTDDIAIKAYNYNTHTEDISNILLILDKGTETIVASVLKMQNHFKVNQNIVEIGIFICFVMSNSLYQAGLFTKKPRDFIDNILNKYNSDILYEAYYLTYKEKITSHQFNNPMFLELYDLFRERQTQYIRLIPDMVTGGDRTFIGISHLFCKNISEEDNVVFAMELGMYLQSTMIKATHLFIEELVNFDQISRTPKPEEERIRYILRKDDYTEPKLNQVIQPSASAHNNRDLNEIETEADAYKRFPFLNPESRNSNIDAIIEVKKRTVELEIKGLSSSEAYSRALQEVGMKYSAPGIKRS